LHLVTRISGSVLEADLLLDAHGRFEAQLEVNLPPARRGWRVARNHLTLGEQQCDVCNLVLTPPEGVTGALAVVLPPALTLQSGALQAPVNAALTASLGRQLQHAEQTAKRPPHVYYLACVPTESDGRAAEMALAATALGWPAGTFVLLPVDGLGPAAALERGLERLRWLYEGSGELQAMRAEAEPAGPAAALKSAFRSAGAAMRSRALGRPTRARLMVRHPVVFCHGMLAFSMLKMSIPEDCNCFSPMRKYMCERGLRALYPQVAPTSGIAERAAQLRDQILHWTDEPVNIIAHSMGGLDARYLIARLGMADHVKSLTTISTPHRGTYLADWILDNFHQRLPLLLALESFGVNIDGFRDCRLAACAAFNEKTPNHPDVRYFSYGASVPLSKLTPVLRRAWNLLKAVEGDNDGMVSVASARWGEYLGTICADHYAQTPDLTFTRPGEDFDVLGFYARLVEDLARRGF
jgi:triacylglycerol lipase